MLTFKQWFNQFDESIKQEIAGHLAEDGYAHYISRQIGRIPTIEEIKQHGQIERLTSDPLPF